MSDPTSADARAADADPVGWLVAHEQIRQLAGRYAVALDARDLDTLVGLFVDDVRVGPDQVGRAALRTSFTEQLRGLGVTILLVGSHVIDVIDEDHATGVVSCRGEIEMGEQWVVQAIQYHDTYERRDGSWLFVRRRHLLFYGADLLERPIGLPPARWPASATGKGELPEALPTWQAFQRDVRS
jgi:ketosteroid isomerase-like protein